MESPFSLSLPSRFVFSPAFFLFSLLFFFPSGSFPSLSLPHSPLQVCCGADQRHRGRRRRVRLDTCVAGCHGRQHRRAETTRLCATAPTASTPPFPPFFLLFFWQPSDLARRETNKNGPCRRTVQPPLLGHIPKVIDEVHRIYLPLDAITVWGEAHRDRGNCVAEDFGRGKKSSTAWIAQLKLPVT